MYVIREDCTVEDPAPAVDAVLVIDFPMGFSCCEWARGRRDPCSSKANESIMTCCQRNEASAKSGKTPLITE